MESDDSGQPLGIGEFDEEHGRVIGREVADGELAHHIDYAAETDQRLGLLEPGEAAAIRRDEVFAAAGSLLATVLEFCWSDSKGGGIKKPVEAARRFATVCMLVRPQLFSDGHASYRELAALTGVTTAAICNIAKKFEREVGCHFRRSIREGAVEKLRQAQRGSRHWRARRRAAQMAKKKPAPDRSRGRGG